MSSRGWRLDARSSNRMSPAGIPMFYGADDAETAIAETYTPTPGEPATVTVAKFETARDALVVDLTVVAEFPELGLVPLRRPAPHPGPVARPFDNHFRHV